MRVWPLRLGRKRTTIRLRTTIISAIGGSEYIYGINGSLAKLKSKTFGK